MKNTFFYDTEIGRMSISDNGTEIISMEVAEGISECISHIQETELIRKAYEQLTDYLCGRRTNFDLPLNPEGTEFQKKVWDALCDIPYGETRSYKQVAEAVGNPKASRAIGMANNRNPIMIFIPCHRVIGADGSLVGYGGGLHIKEKLLSIERVHMADSVFVLE